MANQKKSRIVNLGMINLHLGLIYNLSPIQDYCKLHDELDFETYQPSRL